MQLELCWDSLKFIRFLDSLQPLLLLSFPSLLSCFTRWAATCTAVHAIPDSSSFYPCRDLCLCVMVGKPCIVCSYDALSPEYFQALLLKKAFSQVDRIKYISTPLKLEIWHLGDMKAPKIRQIYTHAVGVSLLNHGILRFQLHVPSRDVKTWPLVQPPFSQKTRKTPAFDISHSSPTSAATLNLLEKAALRSDW